MACRRSCSEYACLECPESKKCSINIEHELSLLYSLLTYMFAFLSSVTFWLKLRQSWL